MGGRSKYDVVIWSMMTVVVIALVCWALIGKTTDQGRTDVEKASEMGAIPSGHAKQDSLSLDSSRDSNEKVQAGNAGAGIGNSQSEEKKDAEMDTAKNPAPPFHDYGAFKPIKAGADERTTWIADGIRKGKPERFSLLFPPKDEDWSLEAFRQNPEPWLNSPSPARVFKTSRPGQNVVGLSATTARLWNAKQSEEITLSVRGVPNDLHTWTSKDAGLLFDADPKRRKETGLNAIAVMSNEDGVSTVVFRAGPGVVADCGILVGGKTSSGQVRFTISVVKD